VAQIDEDFAVSPKPVFRRIAQIGLVVRSVEATAKRCWEEFGIGPWSFYRFDPSNVEQMTIRGKRVDHGMRIASAMIGDIEWEIIEPLDDRSVYAEHLRTHGEGLHHILFDVDDYSSAKARLSGMGFQEMVGGKWNGYPYSYFDTQRSLACLTEIWSPPPPGQPLPQPESTYP
jgi:methylmalonyl-CoA/ethylmalonyl-CoA epimerase